MGDRLISMRIAFTLKRFFCNFGSKESWAPFKNSIYLSAPPAPPPAAAGNSIVADVVVVGAAVRCSSCAWR